MVYLSKIKRVGVCIMANVTKSRGDFLTNWAWFKDTVGGQNLVLCHTSALECLQFFNGYLNEKTIDVYSVSKGEYDNINYRVLNNFENLDVVNVDGVLCTSLNQTINDMLKDFENTDEQALSEALSKYFHSQGESFRGLNISSENLGFFNHIKDWAIDYYSEGLNKRDIARKTYVLNIG